MANAAKGVALALGAAGAGCALTFAGTSLFATPKEARPCPTERERQSTFDGKSRKWDETVRFDEMMAGIGRMRRRLIQHASGNVLEVAVGSGRNFTYYNSAKVQSVTAVDFSRGMLEVADGKRSDLKPISLRLKHASSHKLDFEDRTFDTIVDTFGICSFEAPVQALQEMRRVLKEDGQVLLLEHGASSWPFIQSILDKGAQHHAETMGCYPNRDIPRLVREAGLHIDTDERKHFGTTYLLVCKKNPPSEESE